MNSTLTLNGYSITKSVHIKPKKTHNDDIEQFEPQSRYCKAHLKQLNKHGAGPFCQFVAVGLPSKPGIYVVTVNGELRYVGKTSDLAQRWGSQGYGVISPANCYQGGQSTNCRINNEIFLAAQADQRIKVWFREEDEGELDSIERKLISDCNPRWNAQKPL